MRIPLFLLAASVATAAPEFNRDIRPILSDRCFACHGPDAGNRKGNLRLDTEPGAKSKAIVAGAAAKSPLYQRITSTSKTLRMPPAYAGHDAFPARDVETIRAWIDAGAPWQQHWSFLAPRQPARPALKTLASWPRAGFDWHVAARLEREGLTPSPEASKATLLRRATLDLTGLPPTPAEVDAFLADNAANAYEKVVDRLLASPRHAERMAIRWLEAARYADTNGYQSDGVRTMWPWRDWVINAFARNLPFDQFTIQQVAGDLLPNATREQQIATGFHRNHRTTAEGGIVDEEFRVEYVADRVETTSTVWLGLTMGCTRCHDHKYDPLRQRDFYSMFAFFNNIPGEKGFVYNFGNEAPFIKAPTAEQETRLAQIDARAATAQRAWDAAQPQATREQRAWERTATGPWEQTENRVTAETLPDPRFDGTREVKLGEDKGRFNFRDAYTLMARFKAGPGVKRATILSRMDDYFEGSGWAIYLMDGKLRFHYIYRWTDLGMRLETANPIPATADWQHVTVTYDGSMKARDGHTKIYLNGVDQPLKILFDQNVWPLDHKAQLRIGAGGGDDLRFRGEIADVRIFDREFSPAEVLIALEPLPLDAIVRIPAAQRTHTQQGKLRAAFLDRGLSRPLRDTYYRSVVAAAEREAFLATLPTAMVMQEGPPRAAYLLKRGAYDARGEEVSAAVPEVLPALAAGEPRNRLGLARWLVSEANPLTARVIVNRFWQMLFGAGLVKTVEDFGSQGEWPLHPEVLDWLAVDFRDHNWDMRRLLKTIVMSATYRQSSRVTPELLQRDPENRLLARGARLRLPAEMIRDQALAASGLLVNQLGGPPVRPYQPEGLWNELAGGANYESDRGAGLYRRSLYSYWRRTIAPPSMVTFDSPTREACVVRESRTNTPLQALALMNDVTYVEAARKLAERMLREGGTTPAARMNYAYRVTLGREAGEKERASLARLLDKLQSRYARDAKAAEKLLQQGEAERDPRLDARELAAYTGLASVVLNLDETVTKE